MKYLFSLLLLAISLSISAQDVFKKELFSTDLVMKYRSEINLSDAQADQIKKAHSGQIESFNNTKWDLDNALHKLDKQLAATNVNEKEALAQMEKVLQLEETLKRMRLGLMIKIKNVLSADQQATLKNLRTDADMNKPTFHISSINDHPRMVLKINGDKEGGIQPLYVLFNKKGEETIISSIEKISPDDIESVNVLKDEAAITAYGTKGKNGVIIIKMKK